MVAWLVGRVKLILNLSPIPWLLNSFTHEAFAHFNRSFLSLRLNSVQLNGRKSVEFVQGGFSHDVYLRVSGHVYAIHLATSLF